MSLHFVVRKAREESSLVLAVLLSIILLMTAVSAPEESAPPRNSFPDPQEFGRMLSPDAAAPVSSILFRMLSIVFLTLVVSGLVMNVQGILEGEWRAFSPGPPPEAGWGIWLAVKVAVYFICILLAFQRVESLFFSFVSFHRTREYDLLLLGDAFFQFSLMIFLVLYFLRRSRPPAPLSGPVSGGTSLPRAFPWSAPTLQNWRWSARQAVRGYILFFPALILLILISLGITWIFDLPFQPHPLVQPLLEAGEKFIWPLFAIGLFLGPLAEELFFRGLLFPALQKRMSVFWSAVLSAALFSTLHWNWAAWLPIFGLGMLLAYSYQKTGSILVPVFIHVIHNGLFLAFTVLVFELSGR